MCSIFKYDSVVGRNFDYEISYNEELRTIDAGEFNNKYKIIGVCAGIEKTYPLFYDGMNQYGLCMGALAFNGNANYNMEKKEKNNIPAYAFILKILGDFKLVSEVKEYLKEANITNEEYSDEIKTSELHWFISDVNDSIIVESTKEGLKVYDGDVLTNNPPFDKQVRLCELYSNIIGYYPKFSEEYKSRGVESYGLKGDYTSWTRFLRLKYFKYNLEFSDNYFDDVTTAFHLLGSVEQIYGSTPVGDEYEYTIYSVVYDLQNCKVYLKFYDDLNIENVCL